MNEPRTILKSVVTGAGGFIGSHLVEALLARGHVVVGIDAMGSGDVAASKESNLSEAVRHKDFRLVRLDLNGCSETDLVSALEGADYVFHLAGQPGVRDSWGPGFPRYTRANIEATARLLELCKHLALKRFVFASTSSVYGNGRIPLKETDAPAPVSPYGVTKYAAEHMCRLYAQLFGVPAVVVRYFTVYGPRQRPDMAFSQFIAKARSGTPLTLYANGRIQRDFTFVSDAAHGTILAAEYGGVGQVYNIGSGEKHSLSDVVRTLGQVMGRPLTLELVAKTPSGDMSETLADITKARSHLGYSSKVTLADGLRQQVRWFDRIQKVK